MIFKIKRFLLFLFIALLGYFGFMTFYLPAMEKTEGARFIKNYILENEELCKEIGLITSIKLKNHVLAIDGETHRIKSLFKIKSQNDEFYMVEVTAQDSGTGWKIGKMVLIKDANIRVKITGE